MQSISRRAIFMNSRRGLCLASGGPKLNLGANARIRFYSTAVPPPATSSTSSTTKTEHVQHVEAPLKPEELAEYPFEGTDEYQYPLTFGEHHPIVPGGHLPNSLPHVNWIETTMEYLHEGILAGSPWWLTISLTTIAFRCLLLPLNISLIRNSARLTSIRKDLNECGAIMSSETTTENEKLDAAATYKKLLKDNQCHPLFNMLSPFVMAPFFLSVFLAVERISLYDPGCRGQGGIWWFPDLSSIDPTWALPVLSAATWLLTIELGAAEPRTEFMRQTRSVIRFAASVMVPITAALPSGVFVYWLTSNLFSIVQVLFMRQEKVRKWLNVPTDDDTSKKHHQKPVTI